MSIIHGMLLSGPTKRCLCVCSGPTLVVLCGLHWGSWSSMIAWCFHRSHTHRSPHPVFVNAAMAHAASWHSGKMAEQFPTGVAEYPVPSVFIVGRQ